MPALRDRSGEVIGRVTVLSRVEQGSYKWNCKCACGNLFITSQNRFKKGEKFECNLCIYERKRGIDLTGRKFGRWNVLRRIINEAGKTHWECRCDCGIVGLVSTYSLGRPGKSMSCGCLGRKMRSKWSNPSLYPKASGLSTRNPKFYSLRIGIIHKCYNPEWPTYHLFGGLGITVCDLWRNSAKDMYDWAIKNAWREKMILCLKQGAKEFNPENVYLIDNDEFRSEVGKNNGCQQITFEGQTHSITEWARILQINVGSLKRKMIQLNSIELAFEADYRKCMFHRDPEKVKQAIELYNNGLFIREVANHFKVTGSCISYQLKKSGIKTKRNVNKKRNVKDEEILNLLNSGKNINEIGKILGVSFSCIKERLNKINGVKRKR